MTEHGGLRLGEIVARLGGQLEGDASVVVSQVATLASAGSGQIAFLANPKYRPQLQSTGASAVIVPPKFAGDTALPNLPFDAKFKVSVSCLFRPNQLTTVLAMREGQKVTLTGTVYKYDNFRKVIWLENCTKAK